MQSILSLGLAASLLRTDAVTISLITMCKLLRVLGVSVLVCVCFGSEHTEAQSAGDSTPQRVLEGLRSFLARTARADGTFQPGIDPTYAGMSDCAYRDLS